MLSKFYDLFAFYKVKEKKKKKRIKEIPNFVLISKNSDNLNGAMIIIFINKSKLTFLVLIAEKKTNHNNNDIQVVKMLMF